MTQRVDQRIERLRRFAYWLDAGIPVPGTSMRFGLDPIIGLIPGIGDASGAILGGWILLEGARLGMPRATLVRIVSNIAIDALVGAVPILGDVSDVAWKSNLKNVELLERHSADPAGAGKADRLFIALLGGGVLALCAGVAVGSVLLASWALRVVTAY